MLICQGIKFSGVPKKHFQFSRKLSLLSDISHMDKSDCLLRKMSKVRAPRQFRASLSFSDKD